MEEAGGRGGRWCDDAGEGSRSSGPAGHARKNKASQLHVFARRRRHAHGGELQEATDGLTVAVRGRLASRLKPLPHTSLSAGAPATVSACSGWSESSLVEFDNDGDPALSAPSPEVARETSNTIIYRSSAETMACCCRGLGVEQSIPRRCPIFCSRNVRYVVSTAQSLGRRRPGAEL